MDEGVAWRGVSGLELHGEGPEASGRGALEGCAVVQQVAVQVDTNVSLEGSYGNSLKEMEFFVENGFLIFNTVDRHKFNHLATNSTTFAAFSRPLYCM